jgi:bacillopeptidase F
LFETVDLSEDYVPWNLRLIKADKVWEHSKGKGVTVANIDTGVDFIHPRLKGKYRGIDSALKTVKHEYNWFDPEGLAILPHDCHGHGTHTMGTMVGDGIGVAPEAKWRDCWHQHNGSCVPLIQMARMPAANLALTL